MTTGVDEIAERVSLVETQHKIIERRGIRKYSLVGINLV